MRRTTLLFCFLLACTASQGVTIPASTPPQSPSPGRRLVDESDVTYLGYYDDLNGTGWGQAVTHRYVNGQFRLLTFRTGSAVAELGLPVFFGQQVTQTNFWPNVFAGVTSIVGDHKGLWWEESRERLWTVDAIDYPNDSQAQMGMLASPTTRTLNAAGGGISNLKRVTVAGIGARKAYGSVQATPPAWQKQWDLHPYLIGWGGYASRMAQGLGGDRSIGPVSLGLSVIGIPDLARYANGGQIAASARGIYADHVSGTLGNAPSSTVDRGVRNADVINYYDSGDPRQNPPTPPTARPAAGARWLSPAADGLGRWTWGDSFWHTGMAIDTEDKYGLVLVASLLSGKAFYMQSALAAERKTFEFQVFDPATLRDAWEDVTPKIVKPTSRWMVTLPGLGGPDNTGKVVGAGTPYGSVSGATFDPTTKRIYVYGGWVLPETRNRVWVFQVN